MNDLFASFSQLAHQNSELLKIARISEKSNIEAGQWPKNKKIMHFFNLILDILNALKPLSASIDAAESNIDMIIERNRIIDEDNQDMKLDILALSDKILAIKVNKLNWLKNNRSRILSFNIIYMESFN